MKQLAPLFLLLVTMSGTPGLVQGADTPLAFDDAVLQDRYDGLLAELRCLVCQNQSLADSHAELADDLRGEVHRMLADGASDAEIRNFMVDRYGDFALYNPRASGKTLVLWVVPAAFLLLGGLFLANIVRKRMAMPIDDDPDAGS